MKVLSPRQAPRSGMGGGTSREPGFEGQQGWTAGIPQDWEKQKPHLGRLHGRSYAHEGPVKKTNQ